MKNWTVDEKKVVRYFGMPITATPNLDACRVALECLNDTHKELLEIREAQKVFVYAYQKAELMMEVLNASN